MSATTTASEHLTFDTTLPSIHYVEDSSSIDFAALKHRLAADSFDNGRSPAQLQQSFANSRHQVYAIDTQTTSVVGTCRVLSDGVCNAYVVDLWTYTPYRRRGIAATMLRTLLSKCEGQHVLLTADSETQRHYYSKHFGFAAEPAMSLVHGKWLAH